MINKNSSIYFLLFFIIIVFGFILLLQIVHGKLEQRIATQISQELQQNLKSMLKCQSIINEHLLDKDIYYCENKGDLIVIKDSSLGYIDDIVYLAAFSLENELEEVKILTHKETPGLGDKITNNVWLNSLKHLSYEQLFIKKQGGEVDAFSAASVTPKLLLNSLRQNLSWVKDNQEIIKILLKQGE